MKYDAGEKKSSAPQKVWESTWDYVTARAKKSIRTPQEQLQLQCVLDEVVLKHFGTDDPAFIDQELSRLRKKAEGK
jgi:hypothetical protein